MTAAEDQPGTAPRRTGVSRRGLIASGLAAAGGAVVGAGSAAALGGDAPGVPAPSSLGSARELFHGVHQAGVLTTPQAALATVTFDLRPGVGREALVRLMRIWTDDAARLTAGEPGLADTEPELAEDPARLTVTVGFGRRLLVAAGLEGEAPSWLRPLPAFGVDALEPRWCGGDVVLQVCADDPLVVAHAVRLLTKDARTFVTVRWVQHGFRRAAGAAPEGRSMRNLMGQVDGTRNLESPQDDPLVWVGEQSRAWFGPAPAWLVGGTAMVVRRIAMDLDGWDAVDRAAREEVIGRRVASGAPLTGTREHDEPDLAATRDGLLVIPEFAHVRRARTDDGRQRFLRRPYSYDEPPAEGELSSSGLVFVAFCADVDAQVVPVQRRLDELDLLNRWTTPVGSAVFAVPPGCAEGGFIGETLLG